MTDTPWTEERIKLLTKLWENGLSMSQMARQLGVSRNAVVSKLHRMNLKREDRKRIACQIM